VDPVLITTVIVNHQVISGVIKWCQVLVLEKNCTLYVHTYRGVHINRTLFTA